MNGMNHTEEQFLQKITGIIEANLHNEQFGVNELAREMGMSRITLHRKFKSVSDFTVSNFISQVRLKKGYDLLKQTSLNISEVAYQCGFNSVTYFTKCFHDFYGYPPSETKNHLTPETTEKLESKIHEPKPSRKKRWVQVAIAAAVFVVIFVIAGEVFFYRPFEKGNESIGNTIAIIPFINDSGDEFAPFTTWMGIEIGNKLGKIENMLVVPQSTTETYRDSKKSNRDIARELMVENILRGRTIKSGNKILLNIELLDAKNGQSILTEMYERDIDETEEASLNKIFEICDDVVFQISEVLKTKLTPDEKDKVTKKPTENIAALHAFQEATQHYGLSEIYEHSNINLAKVEFMKAKKLCEDAIKMDSTFADAYTMLGRIYVNRLQYYSNIYLGDKYLDTAKIYLDKAMLYDKNNIDAASYLRWFYLQKGLLDEADKLLTVTENRVKNYVYYTNKLVEYVYLNDKYHIAEAYLNYMETKPADMPPRDFMQDRTFDNYRYMGFPFRARELNEEKFNTVRDTLWYLLNKSYLEIDYGSKDSALMILYQIHKKYPSRRDHLQIGIQLSIMQRDYAKALDTLNKYEGIIHSFSSSLSLYPNNMYGFTYLKNGMKEKADYHFKGSIKLNEDEIKLHGANARTYNSHFNLALNYAILNDKQKSLQYLEMIKQSRSVPLYVIDNLKNSPMFDNIRGEPEFQKITLELEKKYLEEHEKISKLLIRHGLEPA